MAKMATLSAGAAAERIATSCPTLACSICALDASGSPHTILPSGCPLPASRELALGTGGSAIVECILVQGPSVLGKLLLEGLGGADASADDAADATTATLSVQVDAQGGVFAELLHSVSGTRAELVLDPPAAP
jgi:hypothetical protein